MSNKIRKSNKLFILEENPQITISPLNTFLNETGSVSFTTNVIGTVGSMSYSWNAVDSSGTSLNANITGSGPSITFSATLPKQTSRVSVTGTDSNKPDLPVYATALVSVSDPQALFAPQSLSESLSSGTTSTSFTFSTASGGYGSITYGMTAFGPGTLSTTTGRSGSITSLADNDISKVVLTCTDQFGQTATSSYIVGIAADPVFNEEANWNTIFEIDFTNIGTGSLNAAGVINVGGNNINLVNVTGVPQHSIFINEQGMKYSFTGSAGGQTTSNVRIAVSGGISNYAASENILMDFVYQFEKLEYPSALNFGLGDGSNVNDLDSFTLRNYWVNSTTGSIDTRRYQSSTVFTQSIGTESSYVGKYYAGQILMTSQRIPLMTAKEQSDYLGGPKLGTSTPMRGTWTGSPGGSGMASASSLTSAFGTINIHISLSSAASSAQNAMLIKKIRFRRLTRPPSN